MALRIKARRIARKVSRKAYRGAMRMSKRKLAKVYATKCGQVAYVTVKKGSRRRKKW